MEDVFFKRVFVLSIMIILSGWVAAQNFGIMCELTYLFRLFEH